MHHSPLVVGKCPKSGLYFYNKDPEVKSAPNPPVQITTGPYSLNFLLSFSYSTPITSLP